MMLNRSFIFEQVHTVVNTISKLSDENWRTLLSYMTVISIPRGQFLWKTGDFCNTAYFIHNGYCRSFYDKEDKEVNTNFFFENEFVLNIKSFSEKKQSEYSVQACEKMVMVRIEKSKLMNNKSGSPEFESIGRKMLERLIAKQDEHINLFKLYTPQQRYEYIEKNHPEIIQRVALTQIASYLGVTRETLTRIRKKKLGKI